MSIPRCVARLSVLLLVVFSATPLFADSQVQTAVDTQAVHATYEFGDCVEYGGICFQPLHVTLDRPPVAVDDEAIKLWRIDGRSGAETYFEIDPDDLPEFLPPDLAEEAAPHFKSTQRTAIDDTSIYPYSSVLKLMMQVPGTQYGAMCSGMMAGADNVALTAGHCVYSNDADQGIPEGALDLVYVIPGMNGETRPFGIASDEELWIPDAWKRGGNDAFNSDWAVVRLNREIGQRTQWMGIVSDSASNNYFYGYTVHVLGYPGDLRDGEYMYHVQGNTDSIYGNILYHDAYVYQGNSGGPTYFVKDAATNDYEIVGIVSHSTSYGGWGERTGSTMIKSAVTAALREAADCGNGCTLGARECIDETNYRECVANSYGCNVWSWETVCVGGKACVYDGQCTGACEHECSEGQTTCKFGDGVSTCQMGSDGCWLWGELVACPAGQECDGGKCVNSLPDGDDPADGDGPADGDEPLACEGSCQPGEAGFCASSMALCECRTMQWTLSDCSLYCLQNGLVPKGCRFHPGLRVDECLCEERDDADGDVPDGDASDGDDSNEEDSEGMSVGGGGCQTGGTSTGWAFFGILLGVVMLGRRRYAR